MVILVVSWAMEPSDRRVVLVIAVREWQGKRAVHDRF